MEKLKRFDILAVLGAFIIPFASACSYNEQDLQSYYNYYYHQSYYYYTHNYNVCDGSYCSEDLYCQSYNCSGGQCVSKLQPWAIFLITFFSIFAFCTILRCLIVCCRKPQHAVVVRNETNHHQHHNNVVAHSSVESERLIIATQHTEVVTGQRESNANAQNFNNNNNYYGYAMGAPYGTQGTGYPIYQGYGYGNPAMGYQTQMPGVQTTAHLNPNQPQTFM